MIWIERNDDWLYLPMRIRYVLAPSVARTRRTRTSPRNSASLATDRIIASLFLASSGDELGYRDLKNITLAQKKQVRFRADHQQLKVEIHSPVGRLR
jgi:hypothetical protein